MITRRKTDDANEPIPFRWCGHRIRRSVYFRSPRTDGRRDSHATLRTIGGEQPRHPSRRRRRESAERESRSGSSDLPRERRRHLRRLHVDRVEHRQRIHGAHSHRSGRSEWTHRRVALPEHGTCGWTARQRPPRRRVGGRALHSGQSRRPAQRSPARGAHRGDAERRRLRQRAYERRSRAGHQHSRRSARRRDSRSAPRARIELNTGAGDWLLVLVTALNVQRATSNQQPATAHGEWRVGDTRLLGSPPLPRMESWFMTRQYARAAISVSLALAGVTTVFNLTRAAERGRQRVLLPIDSVLSKAYRWR